MQRLAILLGISALLMLPACEQRQEQAQAPQQQPAVSTKEPAPPPTAAQPAPGPDAKQPAGEQAAAPPAAGEQQVTVQQQTTEEQARQQPDQQAAAQPSEQQPAGQARETAEFMGQAPKVEDAPETITLEAKNGNVTLSHRAHAQRMECKTCHGEGKPGKMTDFNKDKAHPLCQGCHKEQGAGPTKCPDCHKKS